jgi:uncharacterized membrane protein YqjE
MSTVDPSERSLGELFSDLGAELSELMRMEVELAKVEARAEATRLQRAVILVAVAGVGALIALIILSIALAWWIDLELNTAVAFAIVGVLWVAVAAAAGVIARNKLREVQPLPETTDAIRGAVTGDRAHPSAHSSGTTHDLLDTTHQISDTTRRNIKETTR